jgi:uncharacterized protein YegL
MELKEAKFDTIFNWLAESMTAISVSNPDAEAKPSDLPTDARIARQIPDSWD